MSDVARHEWAGLCGPNHAGTAARIEGQGMPEVIRPDICVVGAGAGGLQVAVQTAAFGVRVVLVDPHRGPPGQTGADADRSGRLPLSALIAAARRAHGVAQSPSFGVQVGSIRVDFGRVRDHVQGVIRARAPNLARERLAGLGVRVIEGAARFKDGRTLAVAGDIEIAARRFVIATGSSSAIPPIAGLEQAPYLTTETAFDLRACPEHLIVIGAGAVGLEFAQAFRRLGAQVTVVDAAAPLGQEDSECAAVVHDQLTREGIRVRTATVVRVAEAQSRLQVLLKDAGGEEMIEGSHLLVASGRWANVVGLGLDAAGIKYDEHGITVDKGLKTANRRIYAIGDVAGEQQSTHAADRQAGLVVRNALFRLPVRFDPEVIPRVTFTDPELAQVGMTEAVARRRRHRIRVLRWPYRENDRAHAEGEARGHIKVVISRRGRILGVTIVGAGAGELITAWTLAISRGVDIRAVAGIVVPYPTLAEIGKWAATTYFMSSLTSPWVRRIIAWPRRFG
jgi:pyruvate/2-oxoglutarate dehydrogenase complex dihydrolipoamide dehydrogenase (E3) component